MIDTKAMFHERIHDVFMRYADGRELSGEIEGCIPEMAKEMADSLELCVNLLVRNVKERQAISARLVKRWPLKPTSQESPHTEAWAVLAEAHLVFLINDALDVAEYWPGEAAPRDVAQWMTKHCQNELRQFANKTLRLVENSHAFPPFIVDGKYHISAYKIALVFLAWRDVEEKRRENFIAIDASKVHHELITGHKDLPKDKRRPMALDSDDDGERFSYGIIDKKNASSIQLSLCLPEQLNDRLVKAVCDWRGWVGVRTWTALLKLFSEDGRNGRAVWTIDRHLEAMGYSERSRRDPAKRKAAAEEVELFTYMELGVYADGRERERRPIIHVERKIDCLEEDAHGEDTWILGRMELGINPSLYNGVRSTKTNKIGRNWYPAPAALATVDHVRHPHTYALGLILPIRWRWAWMDGDDYLEMQGFKLLQLAGIKYNKRKASQAWAALDRDLQELRRIDGIERWEWTDGSTKNTLAGKVLLYPPTWAVDMTVRGLPPIEKKRAPLICTGADLRKWRTDRGMSQATIATTLGIDVSTIKRAESALSKKLGPSIQTALSKLQS